MSYHVDFHARSRAHAKRILFERHRSVLPEPVLAFLNAALDALPTLKEGSERILRVYAHGHLCSGEGSWGDSNAEIGVTPIEIPD